MNSADAQHEPIPTETIEDICARLRDGKRIRQVLPGGGMLNIDRLLPFLCVYRRNPNRHDAGTAMFVTAEAAFLSAPGNAPSRQGLGKLIRRIAQTAAERLGAFLILEVWSAEDRAVPTEVDEVTRETRFPAPRFQILTRQPHRPEGAVATLEFALQQIKIQRRPAEVSINLRARNHPPGMNQLIAERDAHPLNCYVVGLELLPIYRDPKSGEVYDRILRQMRRGVTRALKRSFFTFALNRTIVRPQHYFSMGRQSLQQLVWRVDRQLADVSSQFKFLLLTTPMNAERSWREFSAGGYQVTPKFEYRPLETDPLLLKRRLNNIPTEQLEDPTLAHVMRQTQDELDRQVTMLADLGTKKFLPGSIQVFGAIEASLRDLALEILAKPISAAAKAEEAEARVNARRFARQANAEIEYYRSQAASFSAQAIVRDDMYSGLLATGGNLLIGRETSLAPRRVEALLQHEVGTHLVTYYNGKAQPLQLLRVGLAGYDGLQEGLAVLAEFLVGGLSLARMRTLAARVVAIDMMIQGESFVATYHKLTETYDFDPRVAYTITLRVYRGGGLTKDAVYLRGLVEIHQYLRKGGAIDPLFVGKLAADHIPVVQEMLLRGVLKRPQFQPRYLQDPTVQQRLEYVRKSNSVLDLLC